MSLFFPPPKNSDGLTLYPSIYTRSDSDTHSIRLKCNGVEFWPEVSCFFFVCSLSTPSYSPKYCPLVVAGFHHVAWAVLGWYILLPYPFQLVCLMISIFVLCFPKTSKLGEGGMVLPLPPQIISGNRGTLWFIPNSHPFRLWGVSCINQDPKKTKWYTSFFRVGPSRHGLHYGRIMSILQQDCQNHKHGILCMGR